MDVKKGYVPSQEEEDGERGGEEKEGSMTRTAKSLIIFSQFTCRAYEAVTVNIASMCPPSIREGLHQWGGGRGRTLSSILCFCLLFF